MIDPITAAETGLVVREAVELAKDLGLVDKVRRILGRDHDVLVIGSTGVGKTSLISSLSREVPEVIDRLLRTETNSTTELKVRETLFTFHDTPGHGTHTVHRRKAHGEMRKENSIGVINVAAYGYHEFDTPTLKDVFEPDLETFLQDHLKTEVKRLGEDVAELVTTEVDWFMTVVNKADLWWSSYDATLEWYRSGDYAHKLLPLQGAGPIVVPYSSVRKTFYGVGDLDGQFDDVRRRQLRARMIAALLGATN